MIPPRDGELAKAALGICVQHGHPAVPPLCWTSVLELQLVSRSLCETIRDTPLLHLFVNENTPPALRGIEQGGGVPPPSIYSLYWTTSYTAFSEASAAGCPWDRARMVTLDLQGESADLAATSWPRAMEAIRVNGDLTLPTGSSRGNFSWPTSLVWMMLYSAANLSLTDVRWPPLLVTLHLSGGFNAPMNGAALPPGLVHLWLGDEFNQTVSGVDWPQSLREISFGRSFNQPIEQVAWPASLELLYLGDGFNQPVVDTKWPPRLDGLIFGFNFDQPLAGVSWPSGLRKIAFGACFNQQIDAVEWPCQLLELSFGTGFMQAVSAVKWPRGLRVLSVDVYDPDSGGVNIETVNLALLADTV